MINSPTSLIKRPLENGIYVHHFDTDKPVFVSDVGFLRLNQILQLLPIGKSTWWAGVKSGRFPSPIRFGRITCWRVEEIRMLIEELSKPHFEV